MRKRLLCLLLSILIILFVSVDASALGSYNAYDLVKCNRLVTDSNSYGGFVYGFSGKTLYSSMLVPNHYNRYVIVPYNIKSACQSGVLSCAMYICDNKTDRYGITAMDMSNGTVSDYTFEGVNDAVSRMFSLSGNYAYFVRADAVYSYLAVYALDGSYIKKCSFNTNIYLIFNNNSITYVMLYDGTIYRLSGTSYTQTAKLDKGVNICNAGIGYIYTENGQLVSLESGETTGVSGCNQNCVVSADGGVYTANNNRLAFRQKNTPERFTELSSFIRCIVAYGGRIATLNYGFDYNDISVSELKSNSEQNNSSADDNKSYSQEENRTISSQFPQEYRIEQGRYVVGVAPSTTVTDFKKKFSDSVTVYDRNGKAVTSGKIGTGYSVSFDGASYTIIVCGDVTGEGNAKSNDINLLMNYFVGASGLDELQMLSADYDCNGVVDNRDLVKLARYSKDSL